MVHNEKRPIVRLGPDENLGLVSFEPDKGRVVEESATNGHIGICLCLIDVVTRDDVIRDNISQGGLVADGCSGYWEYRKKDSAVVQERYTQAVSVGAKMVLSP